jgi:hypothetical protein
VGHIYQQTFIDAYSKAAYCKLYDRKNALAAADMLNDAVVPFFDSHELPLLRVLTDRVAAGIAGTGNTTSMPYIWKLKPLTTQEQKRNPPRPTGYANGLTRRAKTSSIRRRSGKRCIGASPSYNLTLSNG